MTLFQIEGSATLSWKLPQLLQSPYLQTSLHGFVLVYGFLTFFGMFCGFHQLYNPQNIPGYHIVSA